jgi:tetratricopeptide (TPR) repeat protein
MACGFLLEKCRLTRCAYSLYQVGSRFNPMFFHMLGDACCEHAEEQALSYYQAALNQPDAGAAHDPNLLKKLAKVYSKQQKWAEANDCLRQVFELRPGDFDNIYHLAELAVLRGNWFEALYYCKEGLNHDSRNPVLWGHLGYAMYRLDDTEGSVKSYQFALQYGQDDQWKSQIAQTLGQLMYQREASTDAALDYFKQAMALNPNNADAIEMLAEMAMKQHHMKDALEAYNKLLSLTTPRSDIYCALGYVLWQLDRNEEAIDAYLAALHLDSQNAVALNNLGVIYLDEEEQPSKAISLFIEAYKILPSYTLARFNQGRCYQLMGQTKKAAQAYSEARQLNQANPELDEHDIDERMAQLFALGH